MARFFITLAYNGEKYVGWQVQPNGVSVQQMLEEPFQPSAATVKVVGAGRTDAGTRPCVVAHFDWENPSALKVAVSIKQLSAPGYRSSIRAVQPDTRAVQRPRVPMPTM